KREQKENGPEADKRLPPRVRFGTNGRLNPRGRKFFLQVVRESQVNRGAERHVHVLRTAGALLDVFAAQLLRRLAFLNEQRERRIFVVHDLLVLEQIEEAIVRNVLQLLVAPLPEDHRQRDEG